MVLEAIYDASRLRKSPKVGLQLGFIYVLVSTGVALVIAPANAGLVSVCFTSLLLLPSLTHLFFQAEAAERERLSLFMLLKDNTSVMRVYLNMFIGAFFGYILVSMLLPQTMLALGFAPQLGVSASGGATFTMGLFIDILMNNLAVLALCFIISFIMSGGAIFFIIWNASVWGVVFGNMAASAAAYTDTSPIIFIALILCAVMAFVVIEALAYIAGSISGSVLSRAVVQEMHSKGITAKHKYSFLLSSISPEIARRYLQEKLYLEAFSTVLIVNLSLLALGVLLLLAGAWIETLILDNAEFYKEIMLHSFGA